MGSGELLSFFLNPWVNGLILGLLVLGVFLSFRILDIADLSVEGILPLITLLSCVLINSGVNSWLVLLISIGIGALCGVLNSLLTIYLKTPPLLSGIIVMALTFGLGIMINSMHNGSVTIDSGKSTVFSGLSSLLRGFSSDRMWLVAASYLSYILLSLLLVALLGMVLYFFFGTEFGMSIRACGKNKAMSRANGINVNLMVTVGLAISGALIGLASSLYGQHNQMGLPTDGQGMIVIGLSALFLGEAIFGTSSFKKSLISAIVGSLLYWYLIQILTKLDNNGYMLSVYKAILLVLVIFLKTLVSFLKKKKGGNPTSLKESLSKHISGKEKDDARA